MNIDERLEALTQTVELIAGMQKASEERIAKLTSAIEEDGNHIRALLRIAENRLTELEGGQ
jgi:hypothetical protein